MGLLAETLRTAGNGLTHLDLRGNMLGDEGAAVLAGALRSGASSPPSSPNTKARACVLTMLDLSANRISGAGGASIVDAANDGSALQRLVLESNEIDDDGAGALAAALGARSGRGSTRAGKDEGEAAGLAGAQLRQLLLGWNRICAAGAEHLATALASTTLDRRAGGAGGHGDDEDGVIDLIPTVIDA